MEEMRITDFVVALGDKERKLGSDLLCRKGLYDHPTLGLAAA
jgi:hypothetical protein